MTERFSLRLKRTLPLRQRIRRLGTSRVLINHASFRCVETRRESRRDNRGDIVGSGTRIESDRSCHKQYFPPFRACAAHLPERLLRSRSITNRRKVRVSASRTQTTIYGDRAVLCATALHSPRHGVCLRDLLQSWAYPLELASVAAENTCRTLCITRSRTVMVLKHEDSLLKFAAAASSADMVPVASGSDGVDKDSMRSGAAGSSSTKT